jgi:hypothetical protein
MTLISLKIKIKQALYDYMPICDFIPGAFKWEGRKKKLFLGRVEERE